MNLCQCMVSKSCVRVSFSLYPPVSTVFEHILNTSQTPGTRGKGGFELLSPLEEALWSLKHSVCYFCKQRQPRYADGTRQADHIPPIKNISE